MVVAQLQQDNRIENKLTQLKISKAIEFVNLDTKPG